jgi:hypothetical protein
MQQVVRYGAIEPTMDTLLVVIVLETCELPLEIASRPERHAIEELSPYRPDQSLDEGVRQRYVRHSLDLGHIENSEIGSQRPQWRR